MPIFAQLPQYMRETHFHQFASQPHEKSPFAYTHGVEFWDFLDKDPIRRKDFDNYMAAKRQSEVPWYTVFTEVGSLAKSLEGGEDAVLIVDIGGGMGPGMRSLAKAHPELLGRLILQDLEVVIDHVRKDPPQGVELMPHDFFTPQPIKGM